MKDVCSLMDEAGNFKLSRPTTIFKYSNIWALTRLENIGCCLVWFPDWLFRMGWATWLLFTQLLLLIFFYAPRMESPDIFYLMSCGSDNLVLWPSHKIHRLKWCFQLYLQQRLFQSGHIQAYNFSFPIYRRHALLYVQKMELRPINPFPWNYETSEQLLQLDISYRFLLLLLSTCSLLWPTRIASGWPKGNQPSATAMDRLTKME